MAAVYSVSGVAAIAAVTVPCYLLGLDDTVPALLFLFVVVLLSLKGSFLAGALVSIVALISLQTFFLRPLFSLFVSQTVDLVAAGVFLMTSLVITRLVSSQKRSEEDARQRAALLDLTHDTVLARDKNDVITFWNRGAEHRYGWAPGEALGKVSHELLQTVFPAPLAEILATVNSTGWWEGELIHTRRDGTKVIVASRWSLQTDALGQPAGTLETNNDITERKRAEERMLLAQSDLAHAGRVTTLGELAGSIAHEINQPLTGIVADAAACLHWLAADPPALDKVREALAAVVKDGNRAGEVITRIRALIKGASVPRGPCDLAAVIRDVLPLVHPELARHGITIRMVLPIDLPQVQGDFVQLQQVFLNLLMNAADSVRQVAPERRCVVVRTATDHRDDGPWAAIALEDAGVGFSGESASRLFDSFYTTKPGGLGIGLSICRSIVDAHGGKLWASANAEHGATFHVELPGMR